jgi:hypothetical protein
MLGQTSDISQTSGTKRKVNTKIKKLNYVEESAKQDGRAWVIS